MGADAVFISYSHDSPEHSAKLLAFSNKLRELGVDAELDQYHTRPRQGWPLWCEECLRPENAKHVLMICTPTYRNRVENRVAADEGRGVHWEGSVVYQYIYKEKANERFIPVLFGDESDESVPIRMQGYATFRVKAFDLGDAGFEALYRELTQQPAIIKPALGAKVVLGAKAIPIPVVAAPLPEKPALTTFETAAPLVDISRIDRYAPKELIGREAETKLIEDAWTKAVADEAQRPRVMTFVALGGEGKTALVAKWAVGMAEKAWPDAEAAFGWSFYSQGSTEQQASSSDLFLAEALKFFGAPAIEGESPHDKGRRLATYVGAKRVALILDGLEPLQYPPTSPLAGQLKDEGLRALLKGLAQSGKGLCVVTTRYRIRDIEAYAVAAPQRELAPLSEEAGARLLETLGVNGTRKERERLAAEVRGHALTLTIIGGYLRDAYGGDIRQRDRIKLDEADAEEQGGRAFRAMDAYAEWFESDGKRGQQALAILRLLGLFDRPADANCLSALWRAPPIEGLTEPLISLSEAQRNIVLTRLASAKLVTVNRAGGVLFSLDAHPLLREYFAKALREKQPEGWKAGHKRLYEHLTTTTVDKPAPTLEDLQPLYQAIAHGCLAGMQQDACDKVYQARILRGTGFDGFYSMTNLGAYGADLGAVACFFDPPWAQVSPLLTPPTKAWLLGEAGRYLGALGRLTESLESMRASLDGGVAQEDWKNAAIRAGNLSELELILGNVEAAIRDAEAGVAHADRSGESPWRVILRTTHAEALHQAGRKAEARKLFAEAEAMQTELQPRFPLLYSLRGFQYCDLLLADAERAASWIAVDEGQAQPPIETLEACRAVSKRSERTLDWANASSGALLDIGRDHLTLSRAAFYQAILSGRAPEDDDLREAVDVLRRAGQQQYLPGALLTRALFRAVTGAFDGAREDLDEAYEIAERGPMRLHLADIHLYRTRLFGLTASRPADYPWTSPRDDLDAAKKLIDECGYGRRREELADAEVAYQRVYGRIAARRISTHARDLDEA
jgi:TIR domain